MAEESESKPAGGGMGGFIIALVLLAVIGAGAGAGFSLMFLGAGMAVGDGAAGKPDPNASAMTSKPGEAAGQSAKSAHSGEGAKVQIASLDPILVTLAGPQRSWARLELGVILDGPGTSDDPVLLKAMTEDIMGFMRTVPLVHVESAAGVEYLREDLTEIARLRSKGRARSIILRSLVVE
jgi:flagellar FliL protein